MASANKQQKRASRAKAKAKQNRTQRAAAPVELDPNDDRIDFESVDLTELFKKMIDAEKTSQQAMCTAFLEDPLLELVYEQEGEEAGRADDRCRDQLRGNPLFTAARINKQPGQPMSARHRPQAQGAHHLSAPRDPQLRITNRFHRGLVAAVKLVHQRP